MSLTKWHFYSFSRNSWHVVWVKEYNISFHYSSSDRLIFCYFKSFQNEGIMIFRSEVKESLYFSMFNKAHSNLQLIKYYTNWLTYTNILLECFVTPLPIRKTSLRPCPEEQLTPLVLPYRAGLCQNRTLSFFNTFLLRLNNLLYSYSYNGDLFTALSCTYPFK